MDKEEQKLARVRIRQHVNPLSNKYQHIFTPPDWNKIYFNLSLPFHLDIGCGRGRFLLQMAQLQQSINFLGVEIREPLVREANQLRDEYKLKNLHYIFTNINNSSEILLSSLPKNSLELVTIQFPDPWFKKKHLKRRVVQPELVKSLAKYLVAGGKVFLQSDVREVAVEMGDRFLENRQFKALDGQICLEENPFPIPTEREIATINKGEPVYRTMLCKLALWGEEKH
jgi:tRNA (guanine-N7-)-methyltransferase